MLENINIRLNKLEDRIVPINAAVGSSNGCVCINGDLPHAGEAYYKGPSIGNRAMEKLRLNLIS